MQQLVFEAAWEKTIDPDDRRKITAIFEKKNTSDELREKFIPLWQARNYRGDLLVTVIVQNFDDDAMVLEGLPLTYCEAGLPIASFTFSHADLTVAPKCSMPWTFIFPKSEILREPSFSEGSIRENK